MIFESKEKKQKRLEAEAAAKEEAEFEAKMVAKQEKKKVGKTIEEVDKAMKALMEKAAAAKSKGYEDTTISAVAYSNVSRRKNSSAFTNINSRINTTKRKPKTAKRCRILWRPTCAATSRRRCK